MNAIRIISWSCALFCVAAMGTAHMSAQENIDTSGGITLHGSAGFSAEAGNRRDDPDRFSPAGRFALQAILSMGEDLVIPADFYAAAQEGSYGEKGYLAGIHPELWGWLTLHGGYHRATLSPLTLDNDALMGGGIELHPGTFRTALYMGTLRDGMEPGALPGIQGEYRRDAIGLRIGHAGDDGDFVSFNAALISDDTASLAEREDIPPQENALASIAYGFPLIEHYLQVRGEIAFSAFTNDIRDPAIDGAEFLHAIFTPRYSTQFDGAATLALSFSPTSDFDLLLDGRWIGPGYRTLGDPWLANDILEARIAPSIDLFDGRLSLDASLGALYNNLRSQKLATTRRIIGSIAAYAQPWDAFGISAHYMNYGLKTSHAEDTLRMVNISQSFMLAPTFTFDALGGANGVMGTFSYDHSSDAGRGDIGIWESRTGIAGAVWSLTLPSSLTLTTSATHTWSRSALLSATTSTIGEGIAYRLFDNSLFTSLALEYSIARIPTWDNYLRATIETSYSSEPWGTVWLTVTTYPEMMAGVRYVVGF